MMASTDLTQQEGNTIQMSGERDHAVLSAAFNILDIMRKQEDFDRGISAHAIAISLFNGVYANNPNEVP
jgi:hypothetical protein